MSQTVDASVPYQPSYVGDREVMTEEELINFLRIPEVSKAGNYRHVVDNLIKMRNLPAFHVSNRRLYSRQAVLEWVKEQSG